MSEPITFAMMQRQIRRLALERPDYVYVPPTGPGGSCFYFNPDGSCGCIFGHAFHALGISQQELARWDKGNWQGGIRTLWGRLTERLRVESVNGAALSWMAAVQSNQDRCMAWGDCVRDADQIYNLGSDKVEYLPDADTE